MMAQEALDRDFAKLPINPFASYRDAAFHPGAASVGKTANRKYTDRSYSEGLSLRAASPRGYGDRVRICPVGDDLAVTSSDLARVAFKPPEKHPPHRVHASELTWGSWSGAALFTFPDEKYHKPYRPIRRDSYPPAINTPEALLAMLKASGRTKAASRIAELLSICAEDPDEHYAMSSLETIVTFFIGSPKNKNISDISLSPSGTFVASWFRPDGKPLLAMEFLGDRVLLIRRVDGRAKASRMDHLEAQRYLP